MSDLNLFSEIVKTLDFSNASKERLLQFVQQRDSRVINALTNFIKQREGAVSDGQKQTTMIQLKTELEIVLFGRPIQNDQVIKTATVTYTSGITQSPQTTTLASSYNTGPKVNYTTTTTTGAYNPTSTTSYITSTPSYGTTTTTNNYGAGYGGSTTSYTPQTYTIPQTNTYTTNTATFGTGSQPGSSANLATTQARQVSNTNSGTNDYLANLMAQMSNPSTNTNNTGSGQITLQNNNSGNNDGEEVVKRAAARNQLPGYQGAKVQTNSMKNEYNKDNEIEKFREQNKPKLDVTVEVKNEQIRLEQMRLKEFKSKFQSDQPFHEDLYKLFDEITKDLDFPTFLSLRHKLHIDEMGVKELVSKQQEILKNKLDNKQTGINLNEFLLLMNAGSLNAEDSFYLLQIFFYLDFNKNRMLDADEILLGFVMLSSSSEKEKLEAAFAIVDEDGSGTLDISEMTTYMRSVIRMGDGRKMKADHSFEHEFLIEKIAAATAQGIFKEMDLNFDNRISYEEFIVWHNLHGSDVEGLKDEQQNVQKILAEAKKERTDKLLKFNAFTLQNDDFQKITNDRLKMVLDSKLNETSIQMFRDKLQLNHIKFLDAVHYLKDFKISDRLGFGAFFTFMKDLYNRCSVKINLDVLKTELTEFYSAIDIDNNGFIDWNEILGAFSLLCTGTENEKIRGIFDVFDQNDDQILQFHEMYTLFLSSFNLIFMRNPQSALAREDPAKLAFSMALSAFSDNNLDPYTHGLDMNTFTEWYKKFDII